MKIVLAEKAGFCFGVSRAIQLATESVERLGHVYTLGPIIHNPQVVKSLQEKGVEAVEDIEDIPEGAHVIIRSHGVSPKVYQALEDKGAHIIDATCPYVKRIHQTVEKHHQQGYRIIIVGEREHPEVVGISGWAGEDCICVNSLEEMESTANLSLGQVCIVSQTTASVEKWEEIIKFSKNILPDSKVFCTICNATSLRQTAAVKLAREADAMVVIGGRNSSNTRKLAEICRQYCEKVYSVEELSDVPRIRDAGLIGITAGASTPDWLIKEVISKMDEAMLNGEETNFAEEMDKMFVTLRNGQWVKGTVVLVNNNEVCVNIGYKSDGIIPRAQMLLKDDEEIEDVYQVGDEVEAEVVRVNDGEGNVQLSIKRMAVKKAWDDLEKAQAEDTVFEAQVTAEVKGGVRANMNGVSVFIPASQLRIGNQGREIASYVGETLQLKALEVDRAKRNVIASYKAVLQAQLDEQAEQVWNSIVVGETVSGIVRRITGFGVFVDLGGVDGLIHIGDLAWHHVKDASEIVKVGDTVNVLVLNADKEKNRISLGLKQLQPKPWDGVLEKYPIGSVVEGTVVRITTFGAFVELEKGIDGLVHISQLANQRVAKVEDVVAVGDVVQMQVLDVKPDDKKISLSIKALLPEEEIYEEEAAEEVEEA